MSPAWSPALDTPMWSNQRLCYQDVFRRSQSLSGHMRGITHILVTSGCRLGEMLLLMIRGTIGQQFPEQYPANFVIYPRYICGLGHLIPLHLSQSLIADFLVLEYLPICIHISVMISSHLLLIVVFVSPLSFSWEKVEQ